MVLHQLVTSVASSPTQPDTTLSGNGGSVGPGATSFKVASLPPGIDITKSFDVTVVSRGSQENIRVTGVSGTGSLTWAISRDVEGLTPALTLYDGSAVYLVPTAGGMDLWLQGNLPFLDVRAYGAVGDGTTDDTTAFINAIAAVATTGGTITSPGGLTFRIRQRLWITHSNTHIDLTGSRVFFDPTLPLTDDRCFVVHCGSPTGGTSSARPITGAIALNATTFTATNAGDVTDLVAGDWLVINEVDATVATEVYHDWVQVASVAGSVVTLTAPFRTAFPGTHGTVNFYRITNLVENVSFHNTRVYTTLSSSNLLGFQVGVARRVLFDNCRADIVAGDPFFTYRSAEVTLLNCYGIATTAGATELATVAGLSVQGCTFIGHAAANAISIDYGTCFFSFSGNRIEGSDNVGLLITHGVHDGLIYGNTISAVFGTPTGVLTAGSKRVHVFGNTIIGSNGAAGYGLAASNDTGVTPTITSADNVFGPNMISGYVTGQYGPLTATDTYIQPNYDGAGASSGALAVGPLSQHLGTNANVVSRLTSSVAQIVGLNDAHGAYAQLRIDADPLVLNFNSGTNVGIGVVAPTFLLQVAGTLALAAPASAAPATRTLTIGDSARSGTDTDTAAANGVIVTGLGTGAGAANALVFQTSLPTSAGTGAQSLTNVLAVGSVGSGYVGLQLKGGAPTLANSSIFGNGTNTVINGVSTNLILTVNNGASLVLITAAAITCALVLVTVASATGSAGLRLPHGAAPTSPVDGDLWTTAAGGLFVRINGVTKTVTLS